MSLLFRAHTHLPKVTIDHRRVINIFTDCWKEERTSDKIQTPNFCKQWVTCEKLCFALDSSLTSRANPTMPTIRPSGTHNMCIAADSQLDCLLPTKRFNCCWTVMFKHHPIKSPFGSTITVAWFRRGLSRCCPASQPLTPCTSSRTFWLTHACVLVKFESEASILPHVGECEHTFKTNRDTTLPNICREQL